MSNGAANGLRREGFWSRLDRDVRKVGRATGRILGRVVVLGVVLAVTVLAALALAAVLERVTLLFARGILGGLSLIGIAPPGTGLRDPETLLNNVRVAGNAAFGGAALLLFFTKVVDSFPAWVAFVQDKAFDASKLAKPIAPAFGAVLGVTLSIFAVSHGTNDPLAVQLRFEGRVPPFVQDDGLIQFHIVYEKEAGVGAITDPNDASVAVPALYIPFFKQFMSALAACVQTGTDSVVVRVRGFASSSHWTEVEERAHAAWVKDHLAPLIGANRGVDSTKDAFNLWVADRRAQHIVDTLIAVRDRLTSSQRAWIAVTPESLSLDEMRSRATFRDIGRDGRYSVERGLLTRRADVVLTQAGDCERVRVGGSRQKS